MAPNVLLHREGCQAPSCPLPHSLRPPLPEIHLQQHKAVQTIPISPTAPRPAFPQHSHHQLWRPPSQGHPSHAFRARQGPAQLLSWKCSAPWVLQCKGALWHAAERVYPSLWSKQTMVNAPRMADDSGEDSNSSHSAPLCTFPLLQGGGHALLFLLTSTLRLWSPPLLFARCQEKPTKPFCFIFSLFPPRSSLQLRRCNLTTAPLPRALENRWQAPVSPDKQRNQN